jgi:hypothetical protein
LALNINEMREIRVFCSYADADQRYQQQLERHLISLKRKGLIFNWDRQKVLPGENAEQEISKHLENADLFLLLISSDFIASDYYIDEMMRAIKREAFGEVRVIPILMRSCSWEELPFSHFQILPRSKKAIIGQHTNRDEAFTQVVQEIESVVREIQKYGHGIIEPLQPNTTPPSIKAVHRRKPQRSKSKTVRKVALNPVLEINSSDYFLVEPYPFSIGLVLQRLVRIIRQNFSGRAFKKRCRGFWLSNLFMFLILDLIFLPYSVFLWQHSVSLWLIASIGSFLFFFMGVMNKNLIIGVPLGILYLSLWLIIWNTYLANYLGIHFSYIISLMVVAFISFFRLLLFSKYK